MGYTKEYLMWLIEKYGEEGEDHDSMIERLGEDVVPFGRMREFTRDVLADAVARSRDRPPRWDAFISYAGEHRDTVAAPLAAQLDALGLGVWFDKNEYPDGEWNGILYRFIHEGVACSRAGVVVVSPEYVVKEWTQEEYYGLRLKGTSTLFFVLHGAPLEALDDAVAVERRKSPGGVASIGVAPLDVIARQIADFASNLRRSPPRARRGRPRQ